MKTAPIIVLSSEERKTLTAWSRGRSAPARLVLRAKIVLAAADNKTNESIAAECHTSKPTVGRWRSRFAASRIVGIEKDASRPGRTPAITAETVTRILQKTMQEKPEAATHWSMRSMAKAIGVGKDTVHRGLRLAHRLGSDTLADGGIDRLVVAACSQAGIGYTSAIWRCSPVTCCGLLTGWDRIHLSHCHYRTDVMLRLAHRLGSDTLIGSCQRSCRCVAACSRAGIGYTVARHGRHAVRLLRLAHRLGSDTLPTAAPTPCKCCGLLTGWDRIHSFGSLIACLYSCGLLTGWDRIH